MLAFNWFFLPPTHTFQLSDGANWLALAVYLVTAVVVSALAASARRRAELAELREREAAALAGEVLEAEALRRSDAIKTAVLHAVSHDLRSPLTAIVAASSVLGNPELVLADADRVELVATIRSEAERLDRIVGNLLDLSRLDGRSGGAASRALAGRRSSSARAVEELGPEAERVVADIDADAPPVRVDAVQIERVLVNLLDNALKFSPPGSPVSVRAEERDGELLIHVVDQGPGVAAASVRPSSSRSGAATASRRGAGLGLAIARGFAEANGARVWAEDDPWGGHFVLALPAAERTPVPYEPHPRRRRRAADPARARDEPARRRLRGRDGDDGRAGADERRRCDRPTRSSSTSCCPTCAAPRCAASCGRGRRCP